jgi:hypothetical protein
MVLHLLLLYSALALLTECQCLKLESSLHLLLTAPLHGWHCKLGKEQHACLLQLLFMPTIPASSQQL